MATDVKLAGIDPNRVGDLTKREEQEFLAKRTKSRELWQKATKAMPRGVPSSFQDTPPQPVFIDHGQGSRVPWHDRVTAWWLARRFLLSD